MPLLLLHITTSKGAEITADVALPLGVIPPAAVSHHHRRLHQSATTSCDM
jgi:hypothetical protein